MMVKLLVNRKNRQRSPWHITKGWRWLLRFMHIIISAFPTGRDGSSTSLASMIHNVVAMDERIIWKSTCVLLLNVTPSLPVLYSTDRRRDKLYWMVLMMWGVYFPPSLRFTNSCRHRLPLNPHSLTLSNATLNLWGRDTVRWLYKWRIQCLWSLSYSVTAREFSLPWPRCVKVGNSIFDAHFWSSNP